MLFTGLNNTAVITVSELNRQVSSIIGLNLPWVRIRGEISNLKISASQHVYFTLKDSESLVTQDVIRKWTGRIANWGQLLSQFNVFFSDRLEGYLD